MAVISSIPTARVSNVLVRERLLSQLQFEQSRLLQIQQQISTGQRFILPSEGAQQALRGIAVRDLIQRKEQSKINLDTTASYLGATETALSGVSTLVNDVRALALQSVGAGSTAAERNATAANITQQIDRLLQLSNQQFRGRYLFSGSRTADFAFVKQGSHILYTGATNKLETFSDLVNRIDTNVTGEEAFGALSSEMLGTTDFNPVINEQTRLSSLRAGRGISVGSIAVSDGLHTSTINIAGAETIGDVARLIEQYPPGWNADPPSTRTVRARVTAHGLEITLNGGSLSIGEVGNGTTAGELGIRTLGGFGPGPFQGADVNPALTRTTPLADIFGVRARAYLTPQGGSNDLVIEAVNNGAAYNNVKVKLLDDNKLQVGAGLIAGNEVAQYLTSATPAKAALSLNGASNDLLLTANTPGEAFNDVRIDIVNGGNIGNAATAVYNSGTKTLTLTVDNDGDTQIGTLIAQINATGVFTATRDTTGGDAVIDNTAPVLGTNFGTNVTNTFNTGSDANTLVVRIESGLTTANHVIAAINATGSFTARFDASEPGNVGTGVVFDSTIDSGTQATTAGGNGTNFDTTGLKIVNGGAAYTLSFAGAETIDDLLNVINTSGAGVRAEINDAGTGIDIRSALSGTELYIGENGGGTATQLGVRSLTTDTGLTELNFGAGVRTSSGVDFNITRRDGVTFGVDLNAGTYATAAINNSGTNNALTFSRVAPGTAGNNFSVAIVDSGSGGGDSVALVGNTLTFTVDVAAGFTANEAITLLSGTPTLASQFIARLDASADTGNTGAGNLAVTSAVKFSGGKATVDTIGDVLNAINNAPTNLNAGSPTVARLASVGNGIELVDSSVGAGTLAVSAGASAITGIDLGLFPEGQTTSGTPTTSGGNQILTGVDKHPIEVRGLFTALMRLRDAIAAGDNAAIQRGVGLLDEAGDKVTKARGDVGLRSQAVDLYLQQFQDQKVELEKARSSDLEIDLASTISQLTARQASFEAALRAAGSISQLTLLNFL